MASKGAEAEKRKTLVMEYIAATLGVLIWVVLLMTICVTIWRARKWWSGMENGVISRQLKERLMILIIVLLIYNTVLNSFGPFGMWVPVPRVSFGDFTAAFVFYLIVTRYKLIESWIVSMTNKQGKTNEERVVDQETHNTTTKPE